MINSGHCNICGPNMIGPCPHRAQPFITKTGEIKGLDKNAQRIEINAGFSFGMATELIQWLIENDFSVQAEQTGNKWIIYADKGPS